MTYQCDPCLCPEQHYRDKESFKKSIITLLCRAISGWGSSGSTAAVEANFQPLNSFCGENITSSYQLLARLDTAKYIIIDNDTNADVLISSDGINDMLSITADSKKVLKLGNLFIGNNLYIKYRTSAPTMGYVYTSQVSATSDVAIAVNNVCGAFNPLSTPGFIAWWDGSDTDNITVNASGQISQVNDKASNTYHAIQATNANKPYLSRADNLHNNLLYSEAVNNASFWTASKITTPAVDSILEDNTNDYHQAYSGLGIAAVVQGQVYTIEVEAKAQGRDWLRLQVGNDTGFTSSVYQFFDLTNGVVGSSAGGALNPSITPLGSGWYRCSFQRAANATTAATSMHVVIGNADGSGAYAGDITKGLYVRNMSIRPVGTQYVTTTSYPQFAGVNSKTVMYFDGVDDYLRNAAIPLGGLTGCTIIAAFEAIRGANVVAVGVAPGIRFVWGNDGGTSQLSFRDSVSTNYGQVTYDRSGTFCHSVVYSGGNNTNDGILKVYKDGVSKAVTFTGTMPTSLAAGTGITLGAVEGGSSNWANMKLLEIRVFNRALPAYERIQHELDMGAKWGITITVP